MSVWLATPRSLVAIGLLSAAVIGCAPAGTTALNDAVDIVAVILRRVPIIIAETIVLFSVATAAAADRGTELRLPAPGPVRAAQSAPAAAAEGSVAIIAFSAWTSRRPSPPSWGEPATCRWWGVRRSRAPPDSPPSPRRSSMTRPHRPPTYRPWTRTETQRRPAQCASV